ncbi:hypothetical protein RND71_007014 [Anisodus tanguticus]|uniref:Uncharacterized protein n=1 Tax=Anisodus tanguticus TaxID=243964 RepID=A0AAE1SWB2_9SOLA|nr:hypothetical protein RND71_007014 [Anisodus tanguticus]
MDVEEQELGEDASVDQPGQLVAQEKEPSPIAIEAFFERDGGSGEGQEATQGNSKPNSSSANPSRQAHIPPPPATNPTTDKEWITVRRKPNKNRKQKQPSNPTKNSGVDIGTVILAVLAIGNIDTESPQPIATQNLADKVTGNPTQSVGNQRNTADSSTETLAATPENPNQIANPTRPGTPTHNLGEDASVDQPGQLVAQEKEPSPIAIEAFFERVVAIGAKKEEDV